MVRTLSRAASSLGWGHLTRGRAQAHPLGAGFLAQQISGKWAPTQPAEVGETKSSEGTQTAAQTPLASLTMSYELRDLSLTSVPSSQNKANKNP